MSKRYKTNGFLQNIETMQMIPTEFDVVVSKDSHTTVSICHEKMEIQYCVDFTQIGKDLARKATIWMMNRLC